MTKKKNRFFTFIFSMLPGAGEMYMGFMKQGVSLMSLFFFLILISSWLNLGPLIFGLPIVWFYSFFNVINLSSMSDEEFYTIEDDYIIHFDLYYFSRSVLIRKYPHITAIVLIFLGCSIIWNNMYSLIRYYLPDVFTDFIYSISYRIPQVILGVGIIAVGIYLIKSKSDSLNSLEDRKDR